MVDTSVGDLGVGATQSREGGRSKRGPKGVGIGGETDESSQVQGGEVGVGEGVPIALEVAVGLGV